MFAVHSSKLDYDDCIKGIEKYIEELNKSYVDFKIIEKVKWLIVKLNLYFEKDNNIRYKIIYDNKYRLEKKSLNDDRRKK